MVRLLRPASTIMITGGLILVGSTLFYFNTKATPGDNQAEIAVKSSVDMSASGQGVPTVDTHLVIAERPTTIAPPSEVPSLLLHLHGIIKTSGSNGSLALISTEGGNDRAYRTGATLPGATLLLKVGTDRVYIERSNGAQDILLLEGAHNSVTAASEQPSQHVTTHEKQPAVTVVAVGKRFDAGKNPLTLIAVERDGHTVGYRLFPSGRTRKSYKQLGLRSGDILMAVNGSPLTDANQANLFSEYLNGQEDFEVTLERNGKSSVVHIPAGQLPQSR